MLQALEVPGSPRLRSRHCAPTVDPTGLHGGHLWCRQISRQGQSSSRIRLAGHPISRPELPRRSFFPAEDRPFRVAAPLAWPALVPRGHDHGGKQPPPRLSRVRVKPQFALVQRLPNASAWRVGLHRAGNETPLGRAQLAKYSAPLFRQRQMHHPSDPCLPVRELSGLSRSQTEPPRLLIFL